MAVPSEDRDTTAADTAYRGSRDPAAREGHNGVSRIVPVGVPGGIVSAESDAGKATGIARLGGRIANVDTDLYRVWRLAALAPEPDELVAAAGAASISDPAGDVQILEEMGLLVREGHELRARADSLTLTLVGVCLGNRTEAEHRFTVAGRTGRAVIVDPAIYEVLLWATGARSLAAICERVDAGHGPRGDETTLDFLSRSISVFVRTDTVQLDELAP